MSYLHPITPPLSHPLLIYPPPPICLPSLSHPLPIYLSSLSSPASHRLFITLQRSLGRVTVSIKENKNIFRQGSASWSLLGESKPRPNIKFMLHGTGQQVSLTPLSCPPSSLFLSHRKAASWFPNNYMGVPPGTLTAPFAVLWICFKQESRLGVGMGACQSILGRAPKNIFVEWGRERKWTCVWREVWLEKMGESKGKRHRVTERDGKFSHWVKLRWTSLPSDSLNTKGGFWFSWLLIFSALLDKIPPSWFETCRLSWGRFPIMWHCKWMV